MGAKLATRFSEITQICYFVDNAAAAGAIFDPKPQPSQFYSAKFLDDDITHAVEITWCPSHCDIQGNDRADELAQEATQLAWGAPIGTSRTFALCRAKSTTQTAWTRDWQRAPKKGRFAISSRIPQNTSQSSRTNARCSTALSIAAPDIHTQANFANSSSPRKANVEKIYKPANTS
ncbi:hypothetical protein K443DRAFT_4492 [Laccaria amethystina LaAM-08-1]|uniref:RNase H type-1 domain-containing protein n=1 Tax=Laccaria amethystina LaAM-08-1 TaxID=1095629 RepID=A0A0C9Y3R4_9AGAR|nr:hypothetical protein K443DRAFT_4492 [Laccaria amethystina LaAM-08-1]